MPKQEGNYFGTNIIRSDIENKASDENINIKDHQIGFGADYKYAINFNGFFVAPGVFVERNNTEAKISENDVYLPGDSLSVKANTKYRYGIKSDIGYDITNDLSAYLTGGLSRNNYQFTLQYGNGGVTEQHKESGNKIGYFYGLGLAYNINKDISLNTEYNMQKIDYKFDVDKVKADLSVAKIGVSYHF